ncbi:MULTISPECIES: TRAP transporter large permease [Devosia]|uniref:TRAP transporter large permease n=1 Tax=Devosia TaxID=46913 RepID=UPI0027357F8A|nr:TRAP transporter large permease subunit [Devosia sp.]MDP2779396.1 TRAP transporter large permease subunit [Devosia sp.]
MESIILFIMVLTLLFMGVPIAVSLGLSSVLTIALFSSDSMSSVALQLFSASQNYTLLAIPFFVLASTFMSTGGVARRIIRLAVASVGHFRGGLAMASVLACMMFAALSGSSPATVVAIGTIAIAAMRQVGYSKEFSAGIIANAGTLGILIPPSIVMVVYATATNVSVGRMFLAGILPGLVAGAMLMVAIYIVARRRNLPSEPWHGFGEVMAAGKEAGWGLFLIFIIIGGIYGGAFTPTEAASVAAVYSVFVALFVYRDMGPLKGLPWIPQDSEPRTAVGFKASVYALAILALWMISSFFFLGGIDTTTRLQIGLALAVLVLLGYPYARQQPSPLTFLYGLPVWGYNLGLIARRFLPALFHGDTNKAMVDSARTTVMLMFIIVNALLFAHTLTAERIPQTITEWMLGAGFNWFTFLIAVNILLLIGGQFMEPSGLLLIVAPVVFPIAMELGIDPIHLGIIMVVNMEIGMVTPPIGLNLFVTSGITGMSLAQVVKAALPFVMVLMIFLVIVTYVPALSTLVPYALMGPEIILSR